MGRIIFIQKKLVKRLVMEAETAAQIMGGSYFARTSSYNYFDSDDKFEVLMRDNEHVGDGASRMKGLYLFVDHDEKEMFTTGEKYINTNGSIDQAKYQTANVASA